MATLPSQTTTDFQPRGGDVFCRGQRLGRTALRRIQRLIDRHPDATRMWLSQNLCKLFGWRRPNGEWAERSGRELLARLHDRGMICLPPARRHRRKSAAQPALPLQDPLPPWPLPAHSGGDADVRSACLVVRPILPEEREAWRRTIDRHHYLGFRPPIGESVCYAAFWNGALVALLAWASAALRNPARDAYIGWDTATKHRGLPWVVNNVRFLVLPHTEAPHNLASRVLAANLRRLSQDWQVRYAHPVYLAETFVDGARFQGTCYRASNWLEVGQSRGWAKQGCTYHHHGRPKMVFVYPLHRRALQRLRTVQTAFGPVSQERPLNATVADMDFAALPLQGQGGLVDALATIADFRKPRGIRHSLASVLAVCVCAVLCGRKSFVSIAEWAADLSDQQLQRLGCRRGAPPSEPTIRRILSRIDPTQVDRVLDPWVARQACLETDCAIALDGKTLRGSRDDDTPPVHLLSALLHREGLVVAQQRVDAKTNEIPCVKPLLEHLDIAGCVVTADALHTQSATATHLVETKQADYLFTVKDNQPTLREDIRLLDLGAIPPSSGNDRQRPRPHRDAPHLDQHSAPALHELPLLSTGLSDGAHRR